MANTLEGSASGNRRRIGMRLWLGFAFAAVGLITAAAVYLLVRDSSGKSLTRSSAELAVGRTVRLTDSVADSFPIDVDKTLQGARTDGFNAWVVDSSGQLLTPDLSEGGESFSELPRQQQAVTRALNGKRFEADLPGNLTVLGAPVFAPGNNVVEGAVITRATPPAALERSIANVRGDSLTALALAIAAGILIGFAVASLIATRVKRLASSAERMAQGRFDEPLSTGGRDEIGDLARALDAMREALRESFNMLATERDRLSAILDGLTEAVIVVGDDEVRFSNPSAGPLVSDGKPLAALRPSLKRAAERGSAENAWLRVQDRVYAVQARRVPAERAVLLVARDRTEELRRELAEREFVSNAAHELRNPLAGISGAIEVLRAGAKDDGEAREHFLGRLAEDAERMTRLTQSLLTLARVEAGVEAETDVVDVNLAVAEAAEAVDPPEDVELAIEAEPELVAAGDPTLLRQVLIGLLTNAYKNTPAPGTVTLRARRHKESEVMIEVEDTGTGISAEEQDRVFERFYRGSGSLETEGFGLGLSIAKRMVDVMGGEIGVRSAPDSGSTFWVRLHEPQPSPTPVA
jgi:two-component system phosphate regulon sensor histidine kinase PhoR